MKIWFSLASVCLLSACASLLPSSLDKSLQPWKTFEDAKASYDRIEPFVTVRDTVHRLCFDPLTTPNLQIIKHAQVGRAAVTCPI